MEDGPRRTDSRSVWSYSTSAVHVAGDDRVEVSSLQVKQETDGSVVSLRAHQSVENHLHTDDTI